jgi:hypothetical protein
MTVLFARIKVADLDSFKAVHAKAIKMQERFGITEKVWQDTNDPTSLTIAITGRKEDIAAWRESPERAQLAAELRVESSDGNWLTDELFT